MEDYKKKYEGLMKNIKHLHKSVNPEWKRTIECYIPELKESGDETIRKGLIEHLKELKEQSVEGSHLKRPEHYDTWIAWLEKQGEKIDTIENFNTEFEKQVSYLIASTINKEYEYNEGFVKWAANALLNYAKHELEKQGEQKSKEKTKFYNSMDDLIADALIEEIENSELDDRGKHNRIIWIKSHRKKSAWSEEDEKHYQGCLNLMKLSLDTKPYPYYNDYLWLKSLKERMKGE